MSDHDSLVKNIEEKVENLKYEIAQEMGLENKDDMEPPDSEKEERKVVKEKNRDK